jgi:hypothetical protein
MAEGIEGCVGGGGADFNHSQKVASSFLFLALWLKLTAETGY